MSTRRAIAVHPGLNRQVVDWLLEHSGRPKAAALLWAFLLDGLDDRGLVTLKLGEVASRLRLDTAAARELLAEMESIYALRRTQPDGGRVERIVLNPAIAPRPEEALEARPLSLGDSQLDDLLHYLPDHVAAGT